MEGSFYMLKALGEGHLDFVTQMSSQPHLVFGASLCVFCRVDWPIWSVSILSWSPLCFEVCSLDFQARPGEGSALRFLDLSFSSPTIYTSVFLSLPFPTGVLISAHVKSQHLSQGLRRCRGGIL